jgi:cation transport ATPase
MGFRTLEAEIRQFSDSDIQWHLSQNQDHFDKPGIFLLCDELLRRRIKITGLLVRFESLIRHLPTKILRYIDTYDYRFAKASVHVALKEMSRRGTKTSRWLLKVGGVEKGPFSRIELENQVKDLSKGLVWKEGMAEWKQISEMPHLKEPLFYDQDVAQQAGPESRSQPEDPARPQQQSVNLNQKEPTSSLVVGAGILTLVTFPMWVFGLFAVFFSSLTSLFGPLLPFAFACFMMIMAIPLGIGLLTKKKWAWSMKVATSGVVSAWFLASFFLEGTNFVGLVFALFEIIILILLLVGKDQF